MRTIIEPESMPALKGRFSQAIRSDPFIFLAGLIASDWKTGLHRDVQMTPGLPYYGVPTKLQTAHVLDQLRRVAQGAGATLDRAAHVWSILTSPGDLALAQESRSAFFDAKAWPAGSAFAVHELAAAGAAIEIDAILAAPGFEREVIRCARVPQPPPEFGVSQAVKVGPFVFVSSLAATDYATGIALEARCDPEFPHFASPIKRQTEYILRNLGLILTEAGSSLDHVVKAQVFLPDLAHFPELDEVWREVFSEDPPARSVIPARLTIPGALVEVNAIAILAGAGLRKETIVTDRAPQPTIHEPQAIRAGQFVFLSQVMATDFASGVAPEATVDPACVQYESAVKRQLTYVFRNADAVLQVAGSSLRHLVRRQAFFSTFRDNFPAAREVTLATFAPDPPPSTTVSVGTGLLVPGCIFQLDAIGVTR